MKIFLLPAALMVAAMPAAAQDAAKVAPATTRVLFENARIRVVRSTFGPGAREGLHTHPAGTYYVTRGGTLTVIAADGRESRWSPTTGTVEWSDGEGAHSAVNRTRRTIEYVLVEDKTAPTDWPNTSPAAAAATKR